MIYSLLGKSHCSVLISAADYSRCYYRDKHDTFLFTINAKFFFNRNQIFNRQINTVAGLLQQSGSLLTPLRVTVPLTGMLQC